MLSTQYVAGLYDARGTFCNFRTKLKRGVKTRKSVSLRLKFEDGAVLDEVKEWAEGKGIHATICRADRRSAFTSNKQGVMKLAAYDAHAVKLCRVLLPQLRVKRDQAEDLIKAKD